MKTRTVLPPINPKAVFPPIKPKSTPRRRFPSPPYNPHPAPRRNLFLNPSINEFDDPVEQLNEYKKLKNQVHQIKISLQPFYEELSKLEEKYEPNETDKQISYFEKQLEIKQKEKEEIDNKLRITRRKYNETIHSNQEKEVEFLKNKFRNCEVSLRKTETRILDTKTDIDAVINSEARERMMSYRANIRDLTEQLVKLQQNNEELYTQYSEKITSIDKNRTNNQNTINNYKKKLSAEEYKRDKKKSLLRKMKREFEDKKLALQVKIEMKREHDQKVKNNQMWKQKFNIKFQDDFVDDESSKETEDNVYVTKTQLNKNEIESLKVVNNSSLDNAPPSSSLENDKFSDEEKENESDNESDHSKSEESSQYKSDESEQYKSDESDHEHNEEQDNEIEYNHPTSQSGLNVKYPLRQQDLEDDFVEEESTKEDSDVNSSHGGTTLVDKGI